MSSDDRPAEGRNSRSKRRRLLGLGRRLIGRVREGAARSNIPDTATVQFIDARGQEKEIADADTGVTLLAIAREYGVDISSYCGGQCSCGTCRVQVVGSDEGLSPRTPNEAMVLGEAQVRKGERLACQARLVGPARVQLLDLY